MATGLTPLLAGRPEALAVAVLADLALGDPTYAAHPVRLMGASLAALERGLRRLGADGYGGGIALFVILAAFWTALTAALVLGVARASVAAGWLVHAFLVYSLLALGDLLRHGGRVERALLAGDLPAARAAVAQLVGRDTDRLDAGACRRAAIESLSESLTDGFASALFWYAIAGLPGLVLFKVVSTMDSMVGFKTPRHLRFGWCGARLDDAMNFVPARLAWLVIAAVAAALPGCSGLAALRVGWEQHAILPSPNSGWSEAATAGAIRRRLIGPIYRGGVLVTDVWLGRAHDPPAETHDDYRIAARLVLLSGVASTLAAFAALRIFS